MIDISEFISDISASFFIVFEDLIKECGLDD